MAATYRLGMWRRLLNTLVRTLLCVGLGPQHTYLLTVRGRRTGTRYSTPVTLVEDGTLPWLVAPYGEVAWVHNARAAGQITLSCGGRSDIAAIVVLGPAEVAPVLKQYITEVPSTRPFFDAKPGSTVQAFVAEAHRHPVFRICGRTGKPSTPHSLPSGMSDRFPRLTLDLRHADARVPHECSASS